MLRQLAQVSFTQPATNLAKPFPSTLFFGNSPNMGRPWSLSYADFDVIVIDSVTGNPTLAVANQTQLLCTLSLNLRDLLLYNRQLIFDQTQAAYVVNPFKERVDLGGTLVNNADPFWFGLANVSYQLIAALYPQITLTCSIVGDYLHASENPPGFATPERQGVPLAPPGGRPNVRPGQRRDPREIPNP